MDSKALDCFIALYEERNMRKTAERLFITQQGVSRIIINLEKELGCDLFVRKRSGMEPTKEGDMLYVTAVHIQTELAEFRHEIGALGQERPRFRLVCAFGALYSLYPVVRRFMREHPEIEVIWSECSDEECDRRLASDEADVGIIINRNYTGRISVLIQRTTVNAMVLRGHPLYGKDRISIRDLRNQKIVSFGNGIYFYEMLRQRCVQEGFYPEMGSSVGTVSMLYRLVNMGEGVGVVGEHVSDIFISPDVKAIPFDTEEITLDYAIVRRRTKKTHPCVELFWDFMIRETSAGMESDLQK